MTLNIGVHPVAELTSYDRGRIVRLGRDAGCDVRVGQERIQGRWTVSKMHAEIRWDGSRWGTLNVSDKAGLLLVYEPGYEEVPLESGRVWVPVRHRWSYSIGRPGRQFHVVCDTDDHRGPAGMLGAIATSESQKIGSSEEEPTAGIESVFALSLTPLERDVLLSYADARTSLARRGRAPARPLRRFDP
jgi:pSer/pThr/pTyr-binding forkhead associated (FHA) protein